MNNLVLHAMDTCNYNPICLNETENNTNNENERFFQKPFMRQLLVSSGLWTTYFLTGLITGAPTVIIPQIRRETNSTEAVSDDMASWLTSVLGVAGIVWVFVLPTLMYVIGRKITFAIYCLNVTVGFIVFYCSTTVRQILISEIILGISLISNFTISPAILTEYSSPRYRGLFLTIKSATFFWGIWVSNAIGTFYHWKNIGILALTCCVFTITILFWPESPYWLATKGKFEKSAKAHRWLKGTDKEAEIELEAMINSNKEYLAKTTRRKVKFSRERLLIIFKCVSAREYYMPLISIIMLGVLYFATAKLACSLYAIDIVKKITGDEPTAYKTMLILDGVTVLGMYVGSGLSKYIKRRILLFTSTSLAISLLFVLSLYLYLTKLEILSENNYVSITLLVIYTLSLSVGPLILCSTIQGEIVPVRYKSSLLMISSLFLSSIYTGYLKLVPTLFRHLGLHGTFLIFAVSSTICAVLLYHFLPETKDKTLQEIEEHFRNNSQQVSEGRELMSTKLTILNTE